LLGAKRPESAPETGGVLAAEEQQECRVADFTPTRKGFVRIFNGPAQLRPWSRPADHQPFNPPGRCLIVQAVDAAVVPPSAKPPQTAIG